MVLQGFFFKSVENKACHPRGSLLKMPEGLEIPIRTRKATFIYDGFAVMFWGRLLLSWDNNFICN